MAADTDKVIMAYVHPTEVTIGFHDSLIDLLLWDMNNKRRLFNGGGCIKAYSSANVSNARNGLVKRFLDETKAEWLWFVDSDMVFQADTLERLLINAEPDPESEHWAPMVGGLCYAVNKGDLEPTLYQLHQNTNTNQLWTSRYNTFPKDAMFRVSATGAACLLIHRSVLEAVRERKFSGPYPWFQETQLSDTHPVGEDVTFCFRAGQLGFPLWVDTSIHIGHQKSFIATYDEHVKQVGDPHKEAESEEAACMT